MTGKPDPMADDALTRKGAEMGKMTREEIEKWRSICLSHWASDETGKWLSHEESARQANVLCGLALRALSLESVREETLEEAAKVCDSFEPRGEGGYVARKAAELIRERIRVQHALARVAEGEAVSIVGAAIIPPDAPESPAKEQPGEQNVSVLHDWHERADDPGTYGCEACGSWTANLPLYKDEICDAKERRFSERRKPPPPERP